MSKNTAPVGNKITSLFSEFATHKKASTLMTLLKMLPDPDPILRKRGIAVSAYNELLSYPHVWACYQSRKAGTKKLKPALEPAEGKDEKDPVYLFVNEVLAGLDIGRINSNMLEGPFWGYAPLEIMWTKDSGRLVIEDIVGKDSYWFNFDDQNEMRFVGSKGYGFTGEELPPYKFALVQYEDSYSNPYGHRLLSKVYWFYIFAKNGYKFWFTFTEKYGMPWAIGKHGAGAKDEDIDALLNSLVDMVQDGAAVFPEGNDIELVDSPFKASSAAIYEKLKNSCNAEISKAFLGQTQTTEITGQTGTQASATVHKEVGDEVIEGDIALVEACWNTQIIEWLVLLNFGAQALLTSRPRFRMVEEERGMVSLEMAQRDKTALESGVELSKADYRKRHNLPAPIDEEDTIPAITTGAVGGGIPFSDRVAAVNFAARGRARKPGYPEYLQEEGVSLTVKAFKPTIDLINEQVEGGTTLKGLRRRLDKLGKSIPMPEDMAELYYGITLQGYLQGRYDGAEDIRRRIPQGFAELEAALGKKRAYALYGEAIAYDFADDDPDGIMKPEKALAFFADKVVMPPDEYAELSAEAKKYAFTMAGDQDDYVLGKVKDALTAAIEKGLTFPQFKDDLDAIYDTAGITRANPYHAETVFINNLAGAYNEAQWEELNSDVAMGLFPFRRYYNTGSNVRISHAALNNFVAKSDDPIWKRIKLFLEEHRCKCGIEGLLKSEVGDYTIRTGDKLPAKLAVPGNKGKSKRFKRKN